MVSFIFALSGVTHSAFQPPADDSGEFKVENILESLFICHSHYLVEESLVKWRGYTFFEATWVLLTI